VRSVASIGRYRNAIARAIRDRRAAGDTPAARQRFADRARQLRRRLLFGALVRGCGGPRWARDRAYTDAVLRAYTRRAADRARGVSPKQRARAFDRAVARARAALPAQVRCPPPGYAPGAAAYA